MSDLDPAIWAPVPIAPMPMLAYLRVCILSRSAKRMPKWKFRVSPDIVTEATKGPALWRKQCRAVVAIIEEQITTCSSHHHDKTTPHREQCGAAKEGDAIE